MAAIDYSIGFTREEVEEILAAQKAELKKTLAAYANDGSSVTKRRIDEIHAIIGACQQVLQVVSGLVKPGESMESFQSNRHQLI